MRATTQVIATDRFYNQLHNNCKMESYFRIASEQMTHVS